MYLTLNSFEIKIVFNIFRKTHFRYFAYGQMLNTMCLSQLSLSQARYQRHHKVHTSVITGKTGQTEKKLQRGRKKYGTIFYVYEKSAVKFIVSLKICRLAVISIRIGNSRFHMHKWTSEIGLCLRFVGHYHTRFLKKKNEYPGNQMPAAWQKKTQQSHRIRNIKCDFVVSPNGFQFMAVSEII